MAYYCLHKLGILPSQFMDMDRQERAFVIACVEKKLEAEEKAAKKRRRKKGH